MNDWTPLRRAAYFPRRWKHLDADRQPLAAEAPKRHKGDGGTLNLTTAADGCASLAQTVSEHFRTHMPQRLEGTDSE